MGLTEYKARRNFKRTSEPAGKRSALKARPVAKGRMFVIQKHAASHLHYDFRLEMEGVLKSWAVPKEFPMRKGDRRLAVQVEDHPIDYANFEGTIAPGNYGAGTVMVWDRGSYQVIDDDPVHALEKGKIHFTLNGTKLKGDWTLVRMRSRGESEKPQWLLLKSGSDLPPISSRAEDQSALTKRSLKQIASGGGLQWRSNRPAKKSGRLEPPTIQAYAVPEPDDVKKLPKAKPDFIPPMKCELVAELPRGGDWIYEIKFDGVRALAIKNGKRVSLISRSAKDLTAKYPHVDEALQDLPCKEAVLDGEVVAVDSEGRSSFQMLQSYHMAGRRKPPILYYVFDLLNLNGRNLTGLPLVKRKEMLKRLLEPLTETVRFSASIEADSARVIKAMKARGLEGLIAKMRNSKYEAGQRSGAWVKYKWTREQEFVIGGYTQPQGSRTHFGAILVGYYEENQLRFASKVGTGFDRKLLESLYEQFQELVQPDCPFADLPTKRGADSGSLGVTAAQMKYCTWMKPELVCQVRFSEWTRDGHLRQPVFLGLRDDKKPEEVVQEKPRQSRRV
jgi:bifunctional non-homologous end joining protein LigD